MKARKKEKRLALHYTTLHYLRTFYFLLDYEETFVGFISFSLLPAPSFMTFLFLWEITNRFQDRNTLSHTYTLFPYKYNTTATKE